MNTWLGELERGRGHQEWVERELGRLEAELEDLRPQLSRRRCGLQVGDDYSVRQIASAGDVIRGVASTIGNIDRSLRAMLPGAFGPQASQRRVPCLAFHRDDRPVGSSLLTVDGRTLKHETRLAQTAAAEEAREWVRSGGVPATSIGWLPDGPVYFGWAALERADPRLAAQAAAMGTVARGDVTYFAAPLDVVELSLVPIPANPLALIAAED